MRLAPYIYVLDVLERLKTLPIGEAKTVSLGAAHDAGDTVYEAVREKLKSSEQVNAIPTG